MLIHLAYLPIRMNLSVIITNLKFKKKLKIPFTSKIAPTTLTSLILS